MSKQKTVERGTKDEKSLFNEMKSLSKRVNQRILRIERLTGETNTFATKQLSDYLSSKVVGAWTKKGRVSTRKGFTDTQLKAIIRAEKRFLESDVSTIRGIKKYTDKISGQAGKPISYVQANTYYQAQKDYRWIYDYMSPSEFWDMARECITEHWSKETFINNIMAYIDDRRLDESLYNDLENLYKYVQGVNV